MLKYPASFFRAVESARKTYEAWPTLDNRERLAWAMSVLAAKFSAWEIEERITDATKPV